jgi:hypothetical protein
MLGGLGGTLRYLQDLQFPFANNPYVTCDCDCDDSERGIAANRAIQSNF